MRILQYMRQTVPVFLILFVAANVCYSAEQTVEVIGAGECADCAQFNIKHSNALKGLKVTIDCLANGEVKRKGTGELDEEGKFRVEVPQELVENGKLKEECYAQLHGASGTPCAAHDGIESSKLGLVSHVDGKHTFSPVGKLRFSSATCTSAFLWPFFKYPPELPKFPHFPKKMFFPKISIPHFKEPFSFFPPKKSFPLIWKKPLPPIPHFKKPTLPPFHKIHKPFPPFFKKPFPPPVPVYVKPVPPPVPVYEKPLPPPVPVYVKPVPPPVPVYEKPLPPPVPVYEKPLPPPVPVYEKPLPPPVPVYVKPLPPPVPAYTKPLPPPVPVYEKPLPPPVPVYKKPFLPPFPKIKKPCPPIFKKKPLPPLPPLPQLPPLPELPPFSFPDKKPCPPISKLPFPNKFPHTWPTLPPLFPSHP